MRSRLLLLALFGVSLTLVCAAAGADSGSAAQRLARPATVQPRTIARDQAEMEAYRQYLAYEQQMHANELNRGQFLAAQSKEGRVAVSCPEKTRGLTIPETHVKYWKSLPLTKNLQWTANDRVLCVPMKLRGALDPIIAKLLKNLKSDPLTNPDLKKDPTLNPVSDDEAEQVHRWIAEADRADDWAEAEADYMQQQHSFADEREFDESSGDFDSESEDEIDFEAAQRGGRGVGVGGRGIGRRGVGGFGLGLGLGLGAGGWGYPGYGGYGYGGYGGAYPYPVEVPVGIPVETVPINAWGVPQQDIGFDEDFQQDFQQFDQVNQFQQQF